MTRLPDSYWGEVVPERLGTGGDGEKEVGRRKPSTGLKELYGQGTILCKQFF